MMLWVVSLKYTIKCTTFIKQKELKYWQECKNKKILIEKCFNNKN